MAAIYHPNVVTIIPHYNIDSGRDAVNVIHYQYAGTPLDGPSLVAIANAFDTGWGPQWASWASNSNGYLGCWVIDSSSATGGQHTNASYPFLPGTGSSKPMGDQVAGLISLHGFTRYRGGHARLYIPGGDGGLLNSDGRNISSTGTAYLTQMWTHAVDNLNALPPANGGPVVPIIWHKKWKANPNSIETLSNFTVQTLTATQRRRLRKVSRHKKAAVPTP